MKKLFFNYKFRLILLIIFGIFITYLFLSFKYYIINVFNEKELISQKILFSNNTYAILKNLTENYDINNYNNSIDIQKKVILINLYKKSYKEIIIDNKYKYKVVIDFNTTKNQLISYIKDIINKDFSNNKKIKYKIHQFDLIKSSTIYVYLLNSVNFYFGNKKITIYYYKDQKNLNYKIINNLKNYVSKNIHKLISLKNTKLEKIEKLDLFKEYQLVSFTNNNYDFNNNEEYQLNINVEVSYKQKIGYKIIYKYTDKLPLGTQKILTNGAVGQTIIKEIRNYKSYNDYSVISLNKIILKKPIDEVILVGIKELKLNENQILKVLEMEASAYTSGIGNVGYYTATGHRVRKGIVAVDPSVIPLGTKLYIQGYGYAVALDKGSAIKGNRIDLYFENYNDVINWGRRRVKVFILK
ncbi:MAG: 3D domain-containing protein [bacterium]